MKEEINLYNFTTDKKIKDWITKTYNIKVLFLTITGSHMWNLDTKESDLDIRGIYIKPTKQILSIHKGRDTIERISIMGKDIDIQLYEIEKVLNMLLKSNGNTIEMLLSPLAFYQDKTIDWRNLAKKSISRKLANYYKGYAHSQREKAARNRGGKVLIYTFREMMAGIWLIRTGNILYDFKQLKPKFEKWYGFHSVLLDWAIENKNTVVKKETWDKEFMKDWYALNVIFDDEISKTMLPKETNNYNEFNSLLLELRKKYEKEDDI